MRTASVPLGIAALLHIVGAVVLWRWSAELAERTSLPLPEPEWWVAVAGAAMAGWGFNQVAAATSGTRAAILSAVVGQLAAGVMLIGLWVLNDRWQLGVAGGIEVVLGVWALSGVAPKPLRTA